MNHINYDLTVISVPHKNVSFYFTKLNVVVPIFGYLSQRSFE